jgi:hypothetical protein
MDFPIQRIPFQVADDKVLVTWLVEDDRQHITLTTHRSFKNNKRCTALAHTLGDDDVLCTIF